MRASNCGLLTRRGGKSVQQNFSQTMTFRCGDRAAVLEIVTAWDMQQADSDVMGYMGGRLLVDRADPERYVIIADFGVIDPEVSAAEEALRNNDRPETQAGAARLREIVDGEIEFREFDEIYRTDR
jgi:hypothetical protein